MEKYNGYANYETWVTALWIDNDQHLQREVLTLGEEYADINDFRQELQIFVEDLLPQLGGLAGDLLGRAIGRIDFDELAEKYHEEVAAQYDFEAEEVDLNEFAYEEFAYDPESK